MFIHSYHNAAHAITGISPSMLCFTTPTKIYLSSCIDDTPQPVADTMRKSQNEKYKCIKEFFFKKSSAISTAATKSKVDGIFEVGAGRGK